MFRGVNDAKRKALIVVVDPARGIRSDKGITLIEVMIVIGLLAVIAAFAYPNIKAWLPGYRLKRAARNLFSDMQKTRMSAIRAKANWAIVFDTSNNRYLICSNPGGDNNWVTLADNTVAETINLTAYESGIRYGHGNATAPLGGSFDTDNVTFPNNVVIFTPRGLLAVASGYCYIENERGSTYAIGALTTGVIMIKKWYGSSWK